MAYTDDLKDGRWQKKRLEIFERDRFECLKCHEPNQISVHHLYYEKGFKPWNYDNEALVTLCDKCHKDLHETFYKVSGIIAFKAFLGNIDLNDILK